ncbi:unnamed protein product [Leuciscus chuanchicus]
MNIPRKDGMDREDEEEMNIYANVDPINGSDVRTETKNSQTPQDTGSDTVRNRSSRAVLVCLALLCVLLLTVVIVLCVHIKTKSTNYTEETHLLLTKISNLTEERDELLTRNTQLTKERDGLSSSNLDLIKHRDQLNKEKNELSVHGWIYYKSSLYFISSEKKNWTESRRYCTERGADLIIINNREEQGFVKKISANVIVWTGLTDRDVENTWKWVDGSTPNSGHWVRAGNDQVLKSIAEAISKGIKDSRYTQATANAIHFIKEGQKPEKTLKNCSVGLLSTARDWVMTVDLERQLKIPTHNTQSKVRPDIILVSEATKHLILLELTVSWEERMEEAQERKREKYQELVEDYRRNGWRTRCMPVEVGSRGFASYSLSKAYGTLGITGYSPSSKVRRRYLLCLLHPMATICNLCSGPIVPPDTHLFCVACMGLAHAESALKDGGSCEHCADMSLRAIKARRDEARAAAGIGPTAATEPLVGPPPQPRSRGSTPGEFPRRHLSPPGEVADFVSFGASEEEDSMSLSASENDWGAEQAAPELAAAEQETPADLQDELFRILSKAVEELDLSWKAPDEQSKSKLDAWFFQSSRRQAALKRGTPFFPDGHEHVVKSWAAPQSARTLTSTQAMFAPMDEAGETVATHLCPSAPALGSDRSLLSRACRFTAHQANKAYGAAGEAVSALHAMAILQVLQAKLLKSLDGAASIDADAIRDLRSATDLVLLATKRSAQAIGRSMGFLVVLHRHLWLTLSDVQEADRKHR